LNLKSYPHLAWILTAAALALVALFVLLPPAPGVGKVAPRRGANAPASVRVLSLSETGSPPAVRSLASYARLRQRPLFKPLVKTNTGSAVTGDGTLGILPLDGLTGLPPMGLGLFPSGKPLPVQPTLGPWTYVGYASVDGSAGAVLENKSDHKGRSIQIGDVIEEATVTGISPENVRLTRKGKSFLLKKTDPTEPAKVATVPAPASGAPPHGPGGTPPSGGPPSPSGNASPPPGAPPTNAPASLALPPPAVAPAPSANVMEAEKATAIRKG
jgi:hypothetical protein